MIRVFLVDDHALVRSGLRLLLAAQPDFTIVGEAGNGLELLAQLPTTPTNVVLLDVNMPGMGSPETLRHLQAQYPAVRVLVLSMLDQEAYIFQMLDAGARGYLLKSSSLEEISTGIRTVAAGDQFLCTALAWRSSTRPMAWPKVLSPRTYCCKCSSSSGSVASPGSASWASMRAAVWWRWC